MKLRKLLIPLALLAVIPMAACTPTNTEGGGGGKEEEKTPDHDVLPDLTFDQVKSKLESTFSIRFEEDEEYGSGYLAYQETTESLENAVKNAVKKIDFLKVIEDTKKMEDEYEGETYTYYAACLRNKAEDAELYLYSDEDENKNYLYFSLYVPPQTTSSWKDINIESFFPDFEGEIPAPKNATSFEYDCVKGYADIYAYGAKAKDYAETLSDAGFIVDDEMAEYDIYSACDENETISIMIADFEEDNCLWISIISLLD